MNRIIALPRRVMSRRSGRTLLDLVLNLEALVRQRGALSRMDANQLDDIGVTAAEARREAAKGLWNAPPQWFR